jgi:diguanylate cyclase (GGDEF)-like protein/PAS domain S-box-containing protein
MDALVLVAAAALGAAVAALAIHAVLGRRAGRDGGGDPGDTSAQALLAALVEQSEDAIVGTDANGVITHWNGGAERLLDVTAAEAVGRHAAEIAPPGLVDDARRDLAAVLAGAVVEHPRTRWARRDGGHVEVAVRTSPLRDRDGTVVGTTTIGRGIGERLAAQRRAEVLARAAARLDGSLNVQLTAQALAAIVVEELADFCGVESIRGDGHVQRLAAEHADPDVARASWDLYHATDRRAGPLLTHVVEAGEPLLAQLDPDVERVAAGAERTEMLRLLQVRSLMIVPLPGRAGPSTVLTATSSARRFDEDDLTLLRDLADRGARALENARLYEDAQAARTSAEWSARELREAEERFRAAFEQAPIGIALVSVQPCDSGRFLQVNTAFAQMTGYSSEELRARTSLQLTHQDDREAHAHAFSRLIHGRERHGAIEKRYVHRAGHAIWVHARWSVVRAEGDEPVYCILHALDVTDQKRYESQLQYLADHDPLTGLFNRRRLEQEIERARQFVSRYDEPAALLVLDVDDFKHVNDTYGHAVGDEVLARIAAVIRSHCRETDVVGRYGGDEFAILCPHTDGDAADAVAAHVLELLRGTPLVTLGDRTVEVTASIGVTILEGGDDATTAQDAMVQADVAMYDAKEAGRDRACKAVGGRTGARARSRPTWSQRLRSAIDGDGFELWEQPILTMADFSSDRSEVLLRLRGADDEPIAPGAFLHVAQEFGQLPAIDRWVAERAVQLLAERRAAGHDHHLAINVSGTTVRDRGAVDALAEIVGTAGVDPSRLTFELAEADAVVDLDRSRQFAERMNGLGCRLALDDFGAGFGSFHYLQRLPFDDVKIDGAFVQDLATSATDQHTVRAIVTIAGGLRKATVAEHVTDGVTLELLRDLGVDRAQGYYVGRPRPATVAPPVTAAVAR